MTAVYACRDPRGAHWQLGTLPPATGTLLLIGWRDTPNHVDGGPSDTVAGVLAEGLTDVARVSFAIADEGMAARDDPTKDPGTIVRVLSADTAGRVSAFLRRAPADIALVSTRSPQDARALFDAAGFPWTMQGQVVLLSDGDAAPPQIDRATLLGLLEDDWPARAAKTARWLVRAVMRPGVDGAVAGIYSLDADFEDRVIASLQSASAAAQCEWAVVSEAELADRL